MKLVQYSDPGLLREKIESRLLEEEAVNNLFVGLLKNFSEHPALRQPTHFWFTVEDHGEIQLAGWRTPPFPYGLWSISEDGDKALVCLIEFLKSERLDVPGVVANNNLADAFATIAEARLKVETYFTMNQGIFECHKVNRSLLNGGSIRLVQPQELELLTDWTMGFYLESLKQEPLRSEVRNRLEKEIAQGLYYFFERHGQILSTVATSRSMVNGITVNMVYTPPEFRKNGYATSSVALLTHQLLQAGWKFTVLFTDLDNPTSNSIYNKIGYKMIGRSKDIRFMQSFND